LVTFLHVAENLKRTIGSGLCWFITPLEEQSKFEHFEIDFMIQSGETKQNGSTVQMENGSFFDK